MTRTLFCISPVTGALALIFGTKSTLEKMNIRLGDAIIEKVTGVLVVIYFCLIGFIYVTNAH